jgi:hypothetical protein
MLTKPPIGFAYALQTHPPPNERCAHYILLNLYKICLHLCEFGMILGHPLPGTMPC